MVQIQLHNDCPTTDTLISNRFIDDFMPQANGEFVKVYLYLLRCVQSHAYNFTISEIAVIRALRYWQKAGIVNLDEDPTGQICGIHMLSFDQENPVNALDSVNNPSAASASIQTQPLDSTASAAASQTEVLQPSDHAASAKAEKVNACQRYRLDTGEAQIHIG